MMEKLNEVKVDQIIMSLVNKYDDGWKFENLDTTTFWNMYVETHEPFGMKPCFYIKDEGSSILFPLMVNRADTVSSLFYDEIVPELERIGVMISASDRSRIVNELVDAVEKLPPEARIIRTIRNRLRTLVGEEVERLDWAKIGEKAGRLYYVRISWALEAFLKLGSHKFDSQSCFRKTGCNWFHRYSLAVSTGTFVGYILRQSEQGDEDEMKFVRIGRFWGFVDRDREAVAFSNFYGATETFTRNNEGVIKTAKMIAEHLSLGFEPAYIVNGTIYIGVYRNCDWIIVAAENQRCRPTSYWHCPHCDCWLYSQLLEHSCITQDEIIYCDRCGDRVHEDDVIWIGDYAYCHECATYCDRCGEPVLRENIRTVGNELWCDYCYDEYTVSCYECDEAIDEYYIDNYYEVKLYMSSVGSGLYEIFEPERDYLCTDCYRRLSSCDKCSEHSPELILHDGKYYCVKCYSKLEVPDSYFAIIPSPFPNSKSVFYKPVYEGSDLQ